MADKIATREAYGNALLSLGRENEKIVVLDADLAEATKTVKFKKEIPERFFDCGIAEGNMISIAAGLAASGLIPFASSFAMFAAGRAFEQARNSVGYPHLNVKICATHAGITVGEDGATHQCLEDFATMRSIPGFVVMSPSDAVETEAMIRAAADYYGPCYIRLGRYAVPVINDVPGYRFEIGKGITLREGSDVTLIANGVTVSLSLEAADILAAEGISARVINIHTVKPIDSELIEKCARETGLIITVEEHNVIGGLGSAVCETVCDSFLVPVVRVGIQDRFGRSGKVPALLEMYGLTPARIAARVKDAVNGIKK
ncbi:MAG: transketolase family protein [Clostridia bacterium]|nr:transketolase family protein [Clostridia bacterium]